MVVIAGCTQMNSNGTAVIIRVFNYNSIRISRQLKGFILRCLARSTFKVFNIYGSRCHLNNEELSNQINIFSIQFVSIALFGSLIFPTDNSRFYRV